MISHIVNFKHVSKPGRRVPGPLGVRPLRRVGPGPPLRLGLPPRALPRLRARGGVGPLGAGGPGGQGGGGGGEGGRPEAAGGEVGGSGRNLK